VSGRDALLEAIRQCRTSAVTARVDAYQQARGIHGDASVFAVLIQRMVHAQAAGVAFTADPLSGLRDTVVITAGRGLGERVASGEAMGDEWRVSPGGAQCTRDLEHTLTAKQAATLADLCRRIEQHLKSPQDIEWALRDGRFYVLQARPITALPASVSWIP